MTDRICMECNKFINGRSDKRFCDDGCRNAYNNRRNSEADEMLRHVNSILRKNRNILQALLSKEDKITLPEKTLKSLGFNFEYFTHLYETRAGTTYRFCYEYGYLSINTGIFMVVRRTKKQTADQRKSVT